MDNQYFTGLDTEDTVIGAQLYNSEQDTIAGLPAVDASAMAKPDALNEGLGTSRARDCGDLSQDCDCLALGASSLDECAFLRVCLDKANYQWLMANTSNYHQTFNSLIGQLRGELR